MSALVWSHLSDLGSRPRDGDDTASDSVGNHGAALVGGIKSHRPHRNDGQWGWPVAQTKEN